MKRFNRSAIATTVLIAFMVSASVAGLAWPVFWVPGALLIWYGVVADDRSKIAVHDHTRGGLN